MGIKPKECIDTGKARLGRADALRLARAARRIIVARGRKVVRFDMKKDGPGQADLLKAMLGPTGNLRAPTLRIGQTLLVGFNEEVFAEVIG